MEALRLIRPSPEHRQLYEHMMAEWEAFGGKINPAALRRYSQRHGNNVPYEQWLQWVAQDADEATCEPGRVPQHLFFFMGGMDKLLGACTIRVRLNERLLLSEGHMGGGIRPLERGKGHATRMLALALPLARTRFGIDKVLLTCNKDNLASARTIIKCGGQLENEVVEESGNVVQRYWIQAAPTPSIPHK